MIFWITTSDVDEKEQERKRGEKRER